MAKRHNEYARLLGTAENDIQPFTEQMDGGMDTMDGLPMSGVPDLGMIADELKGMAHTLHHHAHHLGAMADMQPDFTDEAGEPPSIQDEQFEGGFSSLPGGVY